MLNIADYKILGKQTDKKEVNKKLRENSTIEVFWIEGVWKFLFQIQNR